MTGVPKCVDLAGRFGREFRVTWEPGYPTANRPKDCLDPWCAELRGRFGTVCPWGGDLLAVMVDGHRGIAERVGALEGVELVQDGDDERTYTFHVGLFDAVDALVRFRRRPRQTPEQRAASAERMRRVRRQTERRTQ